MRHLIKGIVMYVAMAALSVWSQDGASESYSVTERGPHHRIWKRVVTESLPGGRSRQQLKEVTELANGLHYVKDGQWLVSQEMFELFQNGAIARQGPHQVILAPNLNTPAAVDLLSADGKRFQMVILGLGLFDSATGTAELIAETKDSVGQLEAPNRVIYTDAFDGVHAS